MQVQQTVSQQLSISKLKEGQDSQDCTESKRQRTFSESSSKFESLRKRLHKQIEPDSQQSDQVQNMQNNHFQKFKNSSGLQAIDQQQSVVSSDINMRQKFGHLLPGYMGANYSLEHRRLFLIVSRLDETLQYLRDHRNKVKGVSFYELRKNFQNPVLQLQNFKQIMFLAPHLYNCQLKTISPNNKKVLFVGLPQIQDLNFNQRKIQFRQTLYKYINQHAIQYSGKPQFVKIPTYKFPFEQQEDNLKKQQMIQCIKKCNPLFPKKPRSSINPLDILKDGSLNFEKKLLAQIRKKQQEVRQQKQKQLSVKYNEDDLLKVVDQIYQVFQSKDKSNMFRSTIMADLQKKLSYRFSVVNCMVDQILKDYPDFLKTIEHNDGQIIQIHRKYIKDIRKHIQKTKLLKSLQNKPVKAPDNDKPSIPIQNENNMSTFNQSKFTKIQKPINKFMDQFTNNKQRAQMMFPPRPAFKNIASSLKHIHKKKIPQK